MKHNYDLVVVGGGSAGIGAALKAKASGIKSILLVEKAHELGGILNQCIHDGFGVHLFKQTLTGPEYAHYLTEMLQDQGIDILYNANVTNISAEREVTILVADDAVMSVHTTAVILTSGSYERGAGAINLPGQRISGIYTAGQAQYYLNLKGYTIGQDVLIVGSGDIGLIMARRLSLLGLKVHAVSEIMPFSSGLKRNIVQCLDDFNIPLYLSHKVLDVRGETRVNEVVIGEIDKTGAVIPGSEKTLKVDTLLLAVGLIPYIQLSDKLGIKTSKSRGPIVNELCQTSIPWFFVAGNALHIHDLADDAYFEGEQSGYAASLFINDELKVQTRTLNVKVGPGINYVLPNLLRYPFNLATIAVKLRVNDNYENKRIIIRQGENVLVKKFFQFLFPSELIMLDVATNGLNSEEDITVEVLL